MRLLSWIIQRPILVWSLALVLVAGGLLAYRTMPVDILPDLNYPLVNVITQIPGTSPEDVELLVTRPIENALKGSPNLVRLSSNTIPGMSRITAAFSWETDALAARQVVSTRLAQVQATLPAGIVPHLESLGTSLMEVAGYRVAGAQDPMVLEDWVRYSLAPALRSIQGVANILVMGGGERAYRVEADPVRLAAVGLTLLDLQEALSMSQAVETGGSVNEFGRSWAIQLDGGVKSPEDLAGIVVGRHQNDEPVHLADVASVMEAPLPQAYVTSADGRPAVLFTVSKQPGASTLDVCRGVYDSIQGRRDSFPQGVMVEPYYQQSDILAAVFRSLWDNLWQGGLMTALALVLVLGRGRVTVLLLMALPLSILFAFIWMTRLNLGLNLMALAALVVVIGMIVDDAVIVVENVIRHAELGKEPLSAVMEGTREIVGPDVTGTLTTVAALGPLVLLAGLAGHFAAPFSWTFTAVLTGSLLFSLTIVPVGMSRLLARRHQATADRGPVRVLRLLGAWNDYVLTWLLRHRRITLAGLCIMFLASGALLATNPVRGIPDLDERTFLVSTILPPGTALPESDRVSRELEKHFLEVRHVIHTTRRTGSPESSYLTEGPNHSEIVVALDKEGSAEDQREHVRTQLSAILDHVPGMVYRINEPTIEKIDESLAGTPAIFGITLVGPDTDELLDAAGKIERAAARVTGISNLVNNTKIPTDGLHLDVDRKAAARFGLTPASIVGQLSAALGGTIVTQTVVGERVIPVFLRAQGDSRHHPEDILLRTSEGAVIPAGQVVTIRRIQAPPAIEHFAGARSLTMPAEIEGNPFSVMADLRNAIEQIDLPKDVQVTFSGQLPAMIDSGIQLSVILLASIVIIFALMAVQFRSLLDPFVVLLKVPIDLMGGALALWATGRPLDITVLLGVVTLAGVSVNNGIVLVDFIRRRREQGLGIRESIRDAIHVRFRPILLTGLTTVFALAPAALGWGRGPAILAPLGTFITGGLLVGMLMTINVLPVLYVSLDRFRRRPIEAHIERLAPRV
jgi:CzcA family heavy metal efflux pump